MWTGTTAAASSTPPAPEHDQGHDQGDDTGADPGGPAPLGYQPALDGLRAVALAGVLLFHHGYRSVPGGFLGVSTFFTLSGFLITTLALCERDRTGHLSPARFYERRARRLLPAALLTVAGVVTLRAFTDVGAGRAFRGDVLAALGYVANWRFAATGDGYAALFAEPSP
ncbi:MAG TPA: acyltransferase, partial [Acidimicrobiales bacterium]